MAVKKSRKHIKNCAFTAEQLKGMESSKLGCVKEVPFVNRRYKKKRYLSVKNGVYNRARN